MGSHQSFKQGNAPAVSTSISRPHGEYHATVHSQPAATPDEVHQYHNEEKYVAGVHAPSHDRALDLNHANYAPIHGNHANIHGNHANFHGNHANFHGNHANFHGNHAIFHGNNANFHGNHANIHGNHAQIHGNHALTHTIHRDSINHAHSQTHPTHSPVYNTAPVYKPAPVYHPAPIVHQAPTYKPAPVYHPAPVYKPAHPQQAYHEPAYEGPALYQYGYAVTDDYSGANFAQSENRDGVATSGEYRVALPDGRTQI